MKLYFNKTPDGKLSALIFGIIYILDGIVRVLSFGYIATTATLDYSKHLAKLRILRLKHKGFKA